MEKIQDQLVGRLADLLSRDAKEVAHEEASVGARGVCFGRLCEKPDAG
jgi:hypothetical protein